MLTGLDTFSQAIIKDDKESNFTMKGSLRLTHEGNVFICVAALASKPSYVSLKLLMKDTRLLLIHKEMLSNVSESMRELANLQDETWGEVGKVCGLSGAELRSKTLCAGAVSLGFMQHWGHNELDRLPWKRRTGGPMQMRMRSNFAPGANRNNRSRDPSVPRCRPPNRLHHHDQKRLGVRRPRHRRCTRHRGPRLHPPVPRVAAQACRARR